MMVILMLYVQLAGNCKAHLTAVGSLLSKACLGEPSLQNSIEMATRALKLIAKHT